MRKDTRSIKGMEAALRWDISREEEKAKQAASRKELGNVGSRSRDRQDMLDYMQSKAELEHGLQEPGPSVT